MVKENSKERISVREALLSRANNPTPEDRCESIATNLMSKFIEEPDVWQEIEKYLKENNPDIYYNHPEYWNIGDPANHLAVYAGSEWSYKFLNRKFTDPNFCEQDVEDLGNELERLLNIPTNKLLEDTSFNLLITCLIKAAEDPINDIVDHNWLESESGQEGTIEGSHNLTEEEERERDVLITVLQRMEDHFQAVCSHIKGEDKGKKDPFIAATAKRIAEKSDPFLKKFLEEDEDDDNESGNGGFDA